MLQGPPPKVIWVRLGNIRKADLESLLIRLWPAICNLLTDADSQARHLLRQLRRFRRHSLNSPKRQEPIMGGSLTQAVSPDHFYSLAPPRTPASNIQTFAIMFAFSGKSDQIAALCRKYDVLQLTVFGSAARDDFDPGHSDIDLIAEFRSPHLPGYADRYLDFALELQSLFGRQVDLLTPRAVRNARLAQAISQDSIRIYESKDSQAA